MRRSGILFIGLALAGAAMGQVPPLVTSAEWLPWYQALLAQRLAECPVSRGITYFFSQAGSDQAGDGSVGQPWKTLAKAQQVLDATAGDVALLFRRGDVWREDYGLDSTAPNVTIGDYGTGEKPLFTPFHDIAPASGWAPTPGRVNTYQRVISEPVMWVKEDDNLDWPYARQSQLDRVEATEGSFWWDGFTTTLYIHPKHGGGPFATDPRVDGKRYQKVHQRGSGVIIRGDGSRLQNIRAQGWGMTPGQVTQQHGIESRAVGIARVVIFGCESHYGMTHAMTHFVGQGGIATFVECKAGLTTFLFDGGSEFNTYASNGGNQTIWDHCTATHGALPSDNHAGRQGFGFYGHTDQHTGLEQALVVSYGCVTRDTAYGCSTSGHVNDLPPATALEEVRGFFVSEVFEGGEGTGLNFQIGVTNAARVNGRFVNLKPPPLAAAALAAWPAGGWAINCTLEVDCTAQIDNYFGLYNAPGQFSSPQLWNCSIFATTRAGEYFFIDRSGSGQSPGGSLRNSVLCNVGPGSCAPHMGNGSGLVGNAYYGVAPAAFMTDPSPIILPVPVPRDGAPSCVSQLSCAALPLPGGVVLGFDQTGVPAARNDIGPLESPPCGNCDGSTTPPVLNVLDFSCFLNAFASGSAAANCDGSTALPLLNVLDFSCFLNVFAAGCP